MRLEIDRSSLNFPRLRSKAKGLLNCLHMFTGLESGHFCRRFRIYTYLTDTISYFSHLSTMPKSPNVDESCRYG